MTGLEDLARKMRGAPQEMEGEITKALGRGLEMAKTESQRRTPVLTGYLKSSIGGAGGYNFVRGMTAEVGTNLKYAYYVHEYNYRHKVGEMLFMEKGAKAAIPYIQREMEKVAEKVAIFITK